MEEEAGIGKWEKIPEDGLYFSEAELGTLEIQEIVMEFTGADGIKKPKKRFLMVKDNKTFVFPWTVVDFLRTARKKGVAVEVSRKGEGLNTKYTPMYYRPQEKK
jgi:hypothetical protein